MLGKINSSIESINKFIKAEPFFEFSIYDYSKGDVLIVGSRDMSYYHNIEVWFRNVHLICCLNDWRVDTNDMFIEVVDDTSATTINLKYKIPRGMTIIRLRNEDDIEQLIACEMIDVGVKDVLYY